VTHLTSFSGPHANFANEKVNMQVTTQRGLNLRKVCMFTVKCGKHENFKPQG
jgi:hypothetical protein